MRRFWLKVNRFIQFIVIVRSYKCNVWTWLFKKYFHFCRVQICTFFFMLSHITIHSKLNLCRDNEPRWKYISIHFSFQARQFLLIDKTKIDNSYNRLFKIFVVKVIQFILRLKRTQPLIEKFAWNNRKFSVLTLILLWIIILCWITCTIFRRLRIASSSIDENILLIHTDNVKLNCTYPVIVYLILLESTE